jgi:nucleotide-binding universal stress UspA family protein
MNTIRKILVPTDFSAHADEAFRVAQVLAKATGAEIVVFHMSQPPAVAAEGGTFLTASGDGRLTDVWGRFQNLPPADPAVRVEHVAVVADRPKITHILEMLDKAGCDLIVMGTHGHTRLSHMLFGSVTEDVVRQARCPVMVVKAPTHEPPARPRGAAATEKVHPPPGRRGDQR